MKREEIASGRWGRPEHRTSSIQHRTSNGGGTEVSEAQFDVQCSMFDVRCSKSAFTLIELLVTTAILAVVIGAIGACLAGGIRVWDVARQFNRHEADALVGFRLMRRDMGQALEFEGSPFVGEPISCSFVGVAFVATADPVKSSIPRLARIRYYLSPEHAAWCRGVSAFVWEGQEPESVEILVSDVHGVALRYGALPDSEGAGGTEWSESWSNPTNLPAAVEVELEVGSRERGTLMTQWFVLPLAGEAA